MAVEAHEAKTKCWGCRKTVTLEFYRVYTSDRRHWESICQCGTKNYIYRPDWDHEGCNGEPLQGGIGEIQHDQGDGGDEPLQRRVKGNGS